MTDRLVHRRSKGPVSTPAQRLIELQQEIIFLESQLEQERVRTRQVEAKLERFCRMSDTSFGGIPMAQYRCDMVLWESILNENPQLVAIFEIGTWEGGFSYWLWAQCEARGMYFQTYDAVLPKRSIPGFKRADVFAEASQLGEQFRSQEPCVVFCDGGNKPRELRTFAAELRDLNSLLVVHDWGTEFFPEDVPDAVIEVYGGFCDELNSISRVFRLKGEEHA